MTDQPQGHGWWQAADLKWYPPELHADYEAPLPQDEQPQQPPPGGGPGPGWWQAADFQWYPPELHADYVAPPPPDDQPQRPADLDLAATQQRPPVWAPVPPSRPADRQAPRIGTPPPGAGRKPLAIAAGAVIAVAVIATVVHVLTGRNSQPSTISQPASSSSSTPTATPTPTTAPPVAGGALEGLLLSPDQINTAMGATGMTVDQNTNEMEDESANVADKACLPLTTPAQSAVYAGSGWSALRGQELKEPGDTNAHYVEQDVVLFSSRHDADAFFTASAHSWPACSNLQFTWSGSVWTVGPVSNTDGTLSATKTIQGGNGRTCQQTLTVANNVAIGIVACSYSPPGAGVNIANQIAAKVPT
jgi:serine/threonine kinase PknH